MTLSLSLDSSRRAQAAYDRMEPDERDLTADIEDALDASSDYLADERAVWLDAHGLDLDDELIEGWAEAHRAAVVRDGTALRTLYRAQRFQPLPFGVLR